MKNSHSPSKNKRAGSLPTHSKFSLNPSVVINLLAIVCFTVLGFLIYSNTIDVPFVFDDLNVITDNNSIRMHELKASNILDAAFAHSKNRPVAKLSFALNYYFDRYNPAGYHFINIIIHIINGILLFSLLKLTFTATKASFTSEYPFKHIYWISFFTALIWLVHPAQTQSVTYVVQRMNSMASTFFNLSLFLYAKGRISRTKAFECNITGNGHATRKKRLRNSYLLFFGCGLSGILALGSKENAAALPFFIFLYEWYFFQELNPKWFKSSLKYLIVVAVLFGIVGFLYLGTNPLEKLSKLRDFSHGEFTLAERALTQPRVVVYYLSLIFFPHPSRLNLDYDFPLSHSLFDPITTLFSLIFIVGLIALAIYLTKRERLISFCLLWFLGNLVIESSIIPLAIIFEHRLYLPSMLLCLIPVILVFGYVKINWLRIGALCAIAIVFSVWTYQRNQVWQSDLTLWADCVKKSPNKARPHLNLGQSHSERGNTQEAIEHYRQAIQIDPGYAKARFNLANALQRQDKLTEAITHFTAAIQISPKYIEAHNNLGLVLVKQGRYHEAIKHYREILKIEPRNVQVHLNIGVAFTEQGKTDQAISYFQQALDIDPDDAEAHYNLAVALEIQQREDEAVNHYLEALERNQNHALAHFNAANIFARQNNIDEAIVHYEKSLEIQSNLPQAVNNLAFMYVMRKDYSKALSRFKEVLGHWPDKAEIYYNIACMYSRLEKEEESIEWLQKAIDKGYSNWESIKSDSDLENIRDTNAYKELVKDH